MVVKLKHAFTYETNICFIECCLQKLEFSEKYQAEFTDFLWFYVVLPTHPPVLLFPLSFSSMEEKLRNTNVSVDSKLFDKLIFITLCLVEDQAF